MVCDRERDALGRLVPRRLSWLTLSRAVPGLLRQFRAVPDNYWQRGMEHATVACPCGRHPCIDEGESRQCQCGRIYLLVRDLYVANSPRRPTAATVD